MHKTYRILLTTILFTVLTSAAPANELPKLKKSIDIDSRTTAIKSPEKDPMKKNFIYIESSKLIFEVKMKGPKALDVLRSKCLKKDAVSCYILGQYVQEKDSITSSLPFYKKSCSLKEEKACFLLGSLYQFKIEDKEKAIDAWKFPCGEKKNIVACFNKALALKDLGKIKLATKEFTAQCLKDHKESCIELAFLKRQKGIDTKNLKLFVAPLLIFSKYCERGDKRSCGHAADMAYNLEKMDLAKKYYKMDCDSGVDVSCNLYKEIKQGTTKKSK